MTEAAAITADAVIVGAGIVGASTALELARRGPQQVRARFLRRGDAQRA